MSTFLLKESQFGELLENVLGKDYQDKVVQTYNSQSELQDAFMQIPFYSVLFMKFRPNGGVALQYLRQLKSLFLESIIGYDYLNVIDGNRDEWYMVFDIGFDKALELKDQFNQDYIIFGHVRQNIQGELKDVCGHIDKNQYYIEWQKYMDDVVEKLNVGFDNNEECLTKLIDRDGFTVVSYRGVDIIIPYFNQEHDGN